MDLSKPTNIAKPIISTIYTADPSAVVGQDGVLYIYLAHGRTDRIKKKLPLGVRAILKNRPKTALFP